MKRLIIYIMCLAGFALAGCANEEQTRAYVQTGTESVNQVSRSIIGAKRAELAGDPGVLDAYEKDLDDFVALQRSEFAKLKKQIEEERLQREALVSALASLAVEMVPAGAPALKVAKALGFKIDDAADKALEAANEKTAEVEVAANSNKEEITALTKTTEGITRDTVILEDKLEEVEAEIEVLREGKIDIDKDFAIAQLTLDSLDDATQEKLSNVPENVIVELTKLKADDAAFRAQFQRELELTDAQMESLKGMTTDELRKELRDFGIGPRATAPRKTGK